MKLLKDEREEQVVFRAVGEKDNGWIYAAVPLVGYSSKDVKDVQVHTNIFVPF